MYILVPLPLEKQIQDLLASHRVEEALVLAKGARRNIPKEKFQVCPAFYFHENVNFTVGSCIPLSSDWRRWGRHLHSAEVVISFMISAWRNRCSVKLFCTWRSCDIGRVECCYCSGVWLNFFECITWEKTKQNQKPSSRKSNGCCFDAGFTYYFLLLFKNLCWISNNNFEILLFYRRWSLYLNSMVALNFKVKWWEILSKCILFPSSYK